MITKHPIEIHAAGNFRDDRSKARIATVECLNAPVIFVLYDDHQTHLATCSSPKPLARHAFDCGALSIHHDYDLRLAECV